VENGRELQGSEGKKPKAKQFRGLCDLPANLRLSLSRGKIVVKIELE
jgi:hypothetical protein